ncbi:MAG: hypothetical protein K8R21_11975, partial [Leptospira sp.]|nr:hypothetical protein [Leptospira sp.]
RKFVIAKDFKNLEENTSHPLKTRGMMDDDPIHKIPKKDFQKFIHAFSGQPSGLNSSDLNETEAGFVKRSGKIDPKKDQISENDARIGNMVFKKTDGKWKLVLIYFDEAEYEVVRKKGK